MKIAKQKDGKINFEKTLENMSVGDVWTQKAPFYTIRTTRTKVANYGRISGKSFTVNAPLILGGIHRITRTK